MQENSIFSDLPDPTTLRANAARLQFSTTRNLELEQRITRNMQRTLNASFEAEEVTGEDLQQIVY